MMMQVAQRHFNAHAFVNMAMLLDIDQTGSDGHKGLHVQAAHVSFGFDQMQGTNPTSFLQCIHMLPTQIGTESTYPAMQSYYACNPAACACHKSTLRVPLVPLLVWNALCMLVEASRAQVQSSQQQPQIRATYQGMPPWSGLWTALMREHLLSQGTKQSGRCSRVSMWSRLCSPTQQAWKPSAMLLQL